MLRSKFSYCYENVRDVSNFITEKIFDSFLSGSVPIYWGADNVTEHIPSDCFIDRRNFIDTAELHEFLTSIDSVQFQSFQKAIENFVKSPKGLNFSAESFVSTIVSGIESQL